MRVAGRNELLLKRRSKPRGLLVLHVDSLGKGRFVRERPEPEPELFAEGGPLGVDHDPSAARHARDRDVREKVRECLGDHGGVVGTGVCHQYLRAQRIGGGGTGERCTLTALFQVVSRVTHGPSAACAGTSAMCRSNRPENQGTDGSPRTVVHRPTL